MHTFYKPSGINEIGQQVLNFLKEQSLAINDIDVIILGNNGDINGDAVYNEIGKVIFTDNVKINYKHLCGEYPTSTAFALWLAASVIKDEKLPPVLAEVSPKKIKKILIYNHYENIHHSLMLVSAC